MNANTIKEWRNVDVDVFHSEIVPRNKPVVLRGLINDWPSVEQAKISDQSIVKYLNQFNPDKAKWFNQQYMQTKSDKELTDLFLPILSEKGINTEKDYALKVVSSIKLLIS